MVDSAAAVAAIIVVDSFFDKIHCICSQLLQFI